MDCRRCNRELKNPDSIRAGIGPVCAARVRGRNRQLGPECDFRVVKVSDVDRIVWIVDYDGGERSVTNDAEAVVAALESRYPGYRVIYRDSMGAWDELCHQGDRFTGFKPARELAPEAVA